jgi:hypothetical protein
VRLVVLSGHVHSEKPPAAHADYLRRDRHAKGSPLALGARGHTRARLQHLPRKRPLPRFQFPVLPLLREEGTLSWASANESPEGRRLLSVLGLAVGGDDREIVFRPAHAWLKLSLTKRLKKVADSIGKINARIQRRRIRYLAVRHHDVAHDETASWSKPLRDSAEEIRLPRRSEVVDGERGHDEVERALGERILESS